MCHPQGCCGFFVFFYRMNQDPKIQIRYTDTTHQLADLLTKGNFKRDELLNISHFSSTCCVKNSSLTSCPNTMGKKEKKCGKIEIYSDEPVFSCSDKFLIREKSDCIQKFGDTHSSGETRKQDERKLRIRCSVEFSSAAERCLKLGVKKM